MEDMISGDAGASSSTPPSGIGSSTYDVFLSFRGADTRLNFTDHLYHRFKVAGIIQTFRDEEDLRVGKEILPGLLTAIEESTISIPIISKGYASSKWCLIELTHMLKCKKTMGRPEVHPIFYGVAPRECKLEHLEEGCFAEAFVQHSNSKDLDEGTVQEWKDALNEVTKLKGLEKDKIAQGHEGELVEKVVTEICMNLNKNSVRISDKLVGMDPHMQAMKQLLDINCDDVRVIGIHGMGGIGKTTIAKCLFNELGNHFQQQCSFLRDIREKVKEPKNYDVLRNRLISDLLKRESGRTTFNKNTFEDKKVLIVLDDVEESSQWDEIKISQVNEIIGGRDWFGSGSRIIVTSRNKKVFEDCEADFIYRPTEMNFVDSLLLFSKHAFKDTKPSEGYEDISRKLVKSAAGLPLYLVVIGSMLYKKEKPMWEATFEKLKVIPQKEVQARLKISYDALEYEQQQIFLDIACHFIGKDQTLPVYMWDACQFFPMIGIEALVSLSLITIETNRVSEVTYENVFRMHDHLRDLGRDIVKQENPRHLGERSRLWSHEEAKVVLDNQSGTEKVENLYMKNSGHCTISTESLQGLSSLRYLHLDSSTLQGDFKGLVSSLRWFTASLRSGNQSTMPITNFCANKLAILDLSESDITDGWESGIQIKAAETNLKVLTLSGCRNLTKLPQCLWDMKSLVELDLSDTRITELSEQGIGNLTNLTKLLLSNCKKIKRLPDAMGKLEKLEELDCSSCWSLKGEVPSGIGCNLRKLNLSCTYIKKLPALGCIERLQKLEVLNCMWCTSLEGELPEGIWRLSSLRLLNFSLCEKITGRLPKDISGMSHLETLDLGWCYKLGLPTGLKLPLSLTKLVIPFTRMALDSDSLRSLVNLRYLTFDGNAGCCCEPAAEAGVVDHHNSNNSGTPLLPTIDMPNNLENLTINGNDNHVMSCRLLPAMKFDSSSRLNSLVIEGLLSCSLDLSNCQMLVRLQISHCNKTKEIADFGKLGSTWLSIYIGACASLEVLPNLSTMTRMHSLEIRGCPKLRKIEGLEVLTSLQELRIRYCRLLKKEELHPNLLNSQSLKITFEYEDPWARLKMIKMLLQTRIGVFYIFGLGFLFLFHFYYFFLFGLAFLYLFTYIAD